MAEEIARSLAESSARWYITASLVPRCEIAVRVTVQFLSFRRNKYLWNAKSNTYGESVKNGLLLVVFLISVWTRQEPREWKKIVDSDAAAKNDYTQVNANPYPNRVLESAPPLVPELVCFKHSELRLGAGREEESCVCRRR